MKTIYKGLFLLILALGIHSQINGQVTIDFEVEGEGYSVSGTEGSGFTDVFNRTDFDITGVTNESGFYWAVEDISLTNPSMTIDQIDVSGVTSFTFSIDMLAHHFDDWDDSDELLITYSVDGGAFQNLMWIQNEGDAFNAAAALDTDFDGNGECGATTTLPAITTGTSGCTVSSSDFATFTSATINLSGNSTLDIQLQFNGLTSTDEGIYIDNIHVSAGSFPVAVTPDNHVTSFAVASKTTRSIDLTWTDATGTNLPNKYLIQVVTNGTAFPAVTDGNVVADDLDFTDDMGAYSVTQGTEMATIIGLKPNTAYDIRIIPYGEGTGGPRYKTDGTIPSVTNESTNTSVALDQNKNFDDNSLTSGDWYAYSSVGDQEWTIISGGANSTSNAARMNGFSSGTQPNTDWLISPPIDFDASTNELLSFWARYNFGTLGADEYLKVHYSTDYTGIGDPSGATLTEISFTNPSTSDTWEQISGLDISTISGVGYIIFEYKSTADAVRWDVDEIEILSGSSATAAIRFTFFNTNTESLTIKNLGTVAEDISNYQLCLGPGQYNILSDYSTITGDLNLDPNEEVIIDLTSGSSGVTALPDANGGLGLFVDNSDFSSSDPAILKDYVQWGAANQNRVSQAVTAGRWDDANNFLSGSSPYTFSGMSTDVGASFWNGAVTIQEARNATDGDMVTITGIVTTPNFGFDNGEFYVQDATAGIRVRVLQTGTGAGGSITVNMGDEVTIVGLRGESASEIRIEPAVGTDITVNSTGNTLPAASSINGADVTTTNMLQGSRVQLTGVTVKAGETWPTMAIDSGSGVNVVLVAGDSNEFIIRIDRGESFFDGSTEPTGAFALTGVLGRFNDDAQIWPFVESDIEITIASLANNLQNAELTLFPNPTKDMLRVEIEGKASDDVKASIYSTSGKKVFEGEYNGSEFEMNIESLRAGLYILVLEVGKEKVARRIIKK